MLTGESLPAAKAPGEPVIGATVNQRGTLTVRATKVGAETALAQIIRLVEEAQGGKAPIQRLADRIAAVFVPNVIGIAALTFGGWLWLGEGPDRLTAALLATVAVLASSAWDPVRGGEPGRPAVRAVADQLLPATLSSGLRVGAPL